MNIKKEILIACCAAAALFIIGVVCYAAFPDKQPEDKPVRVMFDSTAGKVLFAHKGHSDNTIKENYNLECNECHCYWDKNKSEKPLSCSSTDCHPRQGGDEKKPKRADALHDRCTGCHVDTGHGPRYISEECIECHAPVI